jgi:hypothetical protein
LTTRVRSSDVTSTVVIANPRSPVVTSVLPANVPGAADTVQKAVPRVDGGPEWPMRLLSGLGRQPPSGTNCACRWNDSDRNGSQERVPAKTAIQAGHPCRNCGTRRLGIGQAPPAHCHVRVRAERVDYFGAPGVVTDPGPLPDACRLIADT